MSQTKTIVVVDDEPPVCTMLSRYLSREGFHVKTAGSGAGLMGILERQSVDLVLLDLVLPGEDGLEIARKLRTEYPDLGIIMVTSKSEEIDKVVGLEIGADDYVAKPFGLRELLARVRSVLRRSAAVQAGPASPDIRGFDGWQFDVVRQRLTAPNGGEVRLTSTEFSLLKAFVDNANKVLSRDRILDLTRGRGDPFDRVVDAQVRRLRVKIEEDPRKPKIIKTVRGGGYVFASVVSPVG